MDKVYYIVLIIVVVSITVHWTMLPFTVSSIRDDLRKLINLLENEINNNKQ